MTSSPRTSSSSRTGAKFPWRCHGAAALIGGHAAANPMAMCKVQTTASCLVPQSQDAMTWRIGNHGFEMTLSNRVPDLIGEHLRPWLSTWLASQGLGLSDIASWAVHPGGPRILDAVEASLELSADALAVSREVLEQYGNMSSPTVLFILQRLLSRGSPRPCVALGFGPGLLAEAALIV